MNNKLVSVIIPTHNGEKNLKRAIDSVLAQTYKSIEIIIVDDNGKDSEVQKSTQKIVETYRNDKIKYIVHETNINGSAARNTGIKNSKGQYIALLDDDDIFLPNNIQNHLEKLDQLPDDWGISYCSFKVYFEDGRVEEIVSDYEGEILYDFMMGNIRIGSSLLLMKKDLAEKLGGFDESFKRHQDWEFIARAAELYKIAYVKNVGVIKYNLDRNSAKTAEQFKDFRLYYLDKMKEVIKTLTKEQQEKIYSYHYGVIGLAYLKNKNIIKSLSWALKTKNPFKTIVWYISSAKRYYKKIIKMLG